jgi:hypothetical protein
MDPVIKVLDEDIFALGKVNDVINVNEMKTFKKSKLITNTYNIPVDNKDDYFSVGKPGSNFHGANWRYTSVPVYNSDGNKIWEGALFDIERNHIRKTATLVCKNTYFSFRNQIINYQSSTWETGATAFKNICDSVGFTKYNVASINTSDAQLDTNSCYLKCDITTDDGDTFIKVIEKLAELSNAYLYVHNDELYFVHWVPFTGGISVNLNGNNKGVLNKAPMVSSPEREIINDYSIDYYESGKNPATDSNSNNIGLKSRNKFGRYALPTFRTGSNEQIVFKDKTSAIYIGEGYIKKTNKNYDTNPEPKERIEFSLFADNDEWLDLQSFFNFTFDEEGYSNTTFETFEFDINEDKDEIKIVAYRV